jgi:hypothetical protein
MDPGQVAMAAPGRTLTKSPAFINRDPPLLRRHQIGIPAAPDKQQLSIFITSSVQFVISSSVTLLGISSFQWGHFSFCFGNLILRREKASIRNQDQNSSDMNGPLPKASPIIVPRPHLVAPPIVNSPVDSRAPPKGELGARSQDPSGNWHLAISSFVTSSGMESIVPPCGIRKQELLKMASPSLPAER